MVPGGAGEVVAAASPWNKVVGARSPSRRRSFERSRRVSGRCLAGVVLTGRASPLREFLASRLFPRAVVGGSVGDGKPVEEGGGGSGLPGLRRPALGV